MNELYHHNALPPDSTVDEYRLIEVLGEGGFGIVYRGEGRYLGDQVAIKEYLPRHLATRTEGTTVAPTSSDSEEAYSWGLKKFQEEARILWNLAQPERHPNIVAVRRFFEANGTTYMVMDFEEARPLSDLLKGNATLPQKRLEAALFSLLNGLKRVHEAGVWHRDIKPANILIRADGSPVLLDFGAARQTLDTQTRSVVAAITPPYAAFEQYAARGNDGPWTDIYALGVTLYRCITGKLPPDAAERADEDSLTPLSEQDLPGYTPTFLAAVDRALEIRAKNRPQSVDEWRSHFDGLSEAAADAQDSGGDTTVLRAFTPPADAPEPASAERVSAPLLGESERLAGSGRGEGSSNQKLVLFGVAIAIVLAGVIGATLIDRDSLFGDPEGDAWQEAQQAGDAASVSDFIRRYPDGDYTLEANALLAKIKQEAAAKAATEAAAQAENADEAAWAQAQAGNTSAAYTAYLTSQPNGKFTAEARSRRDVLEREQQAWNQAERSKNLAGYQSYLQAFPAGAHQREAQNRVADLKEQAAAQAQAQSQAEARQRAAEAAAAKAAELAKAEAKTEALRQQQLAAKQAREQLSWAAAEASDSISAYQAYLNDYSDGANATAARERIAALQTQAELRSKEAAEAEAEAKTQADKQAWASASARNSVDAYRAYMQDYPSGQYSDDAQQRLNALLTPVVTKTTGRYAVRRNANVRSQPSRDGIILGSLRTGNEVRVMARVSVAGETWFQIERGGDEAFVFGSLLREMPREEIIAWNELRIVVDETFGDPVSPGEKAAAITSFLDSYPDSHHAAEAKAERETYREEQVQLDRQRLTQAAAEEAARAKAAAELAEAQRLAEAQKLAESEKLEEARKTAEAARLQKETQDKAQQQAANDQTALTAFPEPSISRDDMQAFFEDKEYVLRQIITDYNRENRIHIRGAAADPRAVRIFSLSVRSALPPSVGDGRYADVNFAIKDGRNEVFRPFRFGILWNDGEPEIISHSRLK
ncbi:serine/threonine protein kinase [Pelagibius sp. Alg239-R121]|uniref:serine/threonine protein kinase n=1 Tax=Pelagibius sp. Alg239-R121 TaxID=2993448 RepID=UPI0024A79A4E|nr:serine/threonine protein kinase [Pelagibius sp. Alg239-R121]